MFLVYSDQSAFYLEDFHIVHFSTINVKAKGGPNDMPALVPSGPRIDIQKVSILVIHYLQNMGVTAHEHVGTKPADQFPRLRIYGF